MWNSVAIGLSLMVLVLPNCFGEETQLSAAVQAVSKGNTKFSGDLYNVLKEQFPGNLIFSGFSISTVIGMIKAGAKGVTAEEIQKGLSFPDDETLFKGYNSLLESLKSNENFTLETANRVYTQTGFSLNPTYVDTVKGSFLAEAQQLNFGDAAESADTINQWVEKVTRNKIKNLISAGDLDALTRMILVNAVYFKGIWKNKFDKKATQKGKFYPTPDEPVDVEMMRLEADFPYADVPELGAKALALPYQGDRLAMLILLPNEKDGLSNMETKLKNFDLSALPGRLQERKVAVQLPRFRLESTIDLKAPLTKLGLSSMFDQTKADFSGIPANPLGTNENLYVSKAIQKAFIEVNEEGSEAAAATEQRSWSRSGLKPEITKFLVHYPFLAFLHDCGMENYIFTARTMTVSRIKAKDLQN